MKIGADTLPPLPRDATDRQPDESVCLHRQQVRIPRTGFEPVLFRAEHDPQHDRGRGVRPHERRAGEFEERRIQFRAPEAPAEGHPGEQADHLQRRRLHGGVAEGGRKTRTPEREDHHGGAALPDRPGEHRDAREIRRLQPPRTRIPLRGVPRGVSPPHPDRRRDRARNRREHDRPRGHRRIRQGRPALAAAKEAGLTTGLAALQKSAAGLGAGLDELNAKLDALRTALGGLHEEIIAAMAELRHTVDSLERLVADECWPLPKYREMLFVY